MRNSTGNPILSDFKSDLSRVARFPTAGQGEQTLGTRFLGSCIIFKDEVMMPSSIFGTVFSQLNAPGVYFKIDVVDPAFI